MKARCPKNPDHKKFVTTAHMMEEWVVDDTGNWTETLRSLQVDHGPDPDNSWECAVCWEKAEVTP